MREVMVRCALLRYLEQLEDATVVKTHAGAHGLLDLVSRPLPWLNPHRVNFMLLERYTPAGAPSQGDDDALRVNVACPPDRVDPNAAWRLADPVALLMRQGVYYEPVVNVALRRHGIVEQRRFHPESSARLAAAVRTFLGVCARDGRRRRLTGVPRAARVVSALALQGRPARAQVLDAFFGMVGLVSSDDLFVPLPMPPSTVLVGDVGSRLSIVYLGDVGRTLRPRLGAAAAEAALAELAATYDGSGTAQAPITRLLERGQPIALSVGATVVPLPGFHASALARSPAYLEHLHAIVDVHPAPDPRVEQAARRASADADAWALRSVVVRRIRSDRDATAELRALRSSLHPLPAAARRRLVARIVSRAVGKTQQQPSRAQVDALVDALLFGQNPMSLRRDATVDIADAMLLTEYDVASGVLELAIAASAPPTPGAGSSLDSQAMMSAAASSSLAIRPQQQQQQQQQQQPHKQKNHGPAAVDHAMPLDEATLVRMVRGDAAGSNSNSSSSSSNKKRGSNRDNVDSHRSSSYKARHVVFLPRVDVYVAIHLAHRTLRSDAPSPLRDAVRFVQNAILALPSPFAADATSTLGRMAAKKRSVADLVDAVGRRGPDYVTSAFEIDALTRFLGVDVVTLPRLDDAAVAPSSRHIKDASSRRLAEMRRKGVDGGDATRSAFFMAIRQRPDGRGHDLALSPAVTSATVGRGGTHLAHNNPPGAGAGHRLLFSSVGISDAE